ncbi:MAG: hypothetical protein ACRDV4_12440, partial [Acidimicrobiales bacterium]
ELDVGQRQLRGNMPEAFRPRPAIGVRHSARPAVGTESVLGRTARAAEGTAASIGCTGSFGISSSTARPCRQGASPDIMTS